MVASGMPPSGTRRLYVYYRVPLVHLHDLLARVRQTQARLSADHPGLQADLLRRPELRDGDVTLMETYAIDAATAADGLDQPLIDHIERTLGTALADLPCGARHAEVFDACA